jgi:adenylate cyclase
MTPAASPFDAISDWLVHETLGDRPLEELVSGCCERLWAAGVPLYRVVVALPTLHPLYAAYGVLWTRGKGVSRFEQDRAGLALPYYTRSPFAYLVRHDLPFVRRRIEGAAAADDFPILAELRAEGVTDYAAVRIRMSTVSGGDPRFNGVMASWATDTPGGFSDGHLTAVQRLLQSLAVACKVRLTEGMTRNVLVAYLGREAGERVLRGTIGRGDGATIRSAIWFSDLRDSTPLAERLTRDEFIAALNCYFDATAGAVMAEGGEVLRFIGDAVLAIFPIGGDPASAACRRAVAAARAACARLAASNESRQARGEPRLAFGLGLHVGDLMFGNIGVPERLEFSVIGPAANEVARLESASKGLGRTVLATRAFAEQLDQPWEPLGPQVLRGVGDPIDVFAMPEG